MSRIEAEAYQRLQQLGSSPLKKVLTAGGGAVNDKWTALRAAAMGVTVEPSEHGRRSRVDEILVLSLRGGLELGL